MDGSFFMCQLCMNLSAWNLKVFSMVSMSRRWNGVRSKPGEGGGGAGGGGVRETPLCKGQGFWSHL